MRTLSPKALLAGLNPSPVFEAVAIFAEGLVLNSGGESGPSEIDRADNSVVPKWRGQMSARFNEETALPLSDI
jgi:hypothetical protein